MAQGTPQLKLKGICSIGSETIATQTTEDGGQTTDKDPHTIGSTDVVKQR